MTVRETTCDIIERRYGNDPGVLGKYVDNGQMIVINDELGVKTECWDGNGVKYHGVVYLNSSDMIPQDIMDVFVIPVNTKITWWK